MERVGVEVNATTRTRPSALVGVQKKKEMQNQKNECRKPCANQWLSSKYLLLLPVTHPDRNIQNERKATQSNAKYTGII